MNQCYLPAGSSISELNFSVTNEIDKVYLFDSKVKKQIEIILGETYLLPEVLEAFKSFSEALAPLVNPSLEFDEGQVKVKDMNDKFDIYDNYFEVSRVNDMRSGQFIQQYLDTSAEIIDEFQYTSMSRGEIAYMLKGWEAANAIILKDKNPDTNFKLEQVDRSSVPGKNEDRALYRWKLAHHGFAVFMITSAYCFEKATELIENGGDEDAIVDWLDKGAHLFRATTACMEFGNSFTATIYRTIIRPDMSKANEEANLPNGFSGTQNLEYVEWRSRKKRLLDLVKAKKAEGTIGQRVLDMVEMFRAFYLEDMHIHSIIAGRMVGMEKSLLQAGFIKPGTKPVKITAADVLRSMAAMRDKETSFLVH